jgi:sugar phosphate isomerase/epimerase
MQIGFHTDAFNGSYWNFERCLQWAQKNDVHRIECGVIDGVSWIHGLGYQPHVALYEDPALLRATMAQYGVQFSQIDAAYPLSGVDGPVRGLPYVLKSIPWAKHAGAARVATMARMKETYAAILETAAAYDITITIEVHGYFTTNPDRMEEMLNFCDSPLLRMNLDTGNSFIAGQDPVAFCERFKNKIAHVHVKDVSESLAAAVRGDQTGIAVSQCAIGDGVNAANIRRCLEILRDTGYTGVLSMECEGQGGPMIERSLVWLRNTLNDLGIPEEEN